MSSVAEPDRAYCGQPSGSGVVIFRSVSWLMRGSFSSVPGVPEVLLHLS